MTKLAIAALIAAALATAGCNGLPGAANSAANATDGAAGAGLGQADATKLSAYTDGYNKLLDTFGLIETKKSYFEDEIARKSASDSIFVSKGWIYQALDQLQKARALSGGKPDVDAAADTLIAALDAANKRLTGLEVYYTSKAYREDGLKRGRAEDPLMRAEFDRATDATERFGALLERERKIAVVAEMAAMKARGDTLGYNTKLALGQASSAIDRFVDTTSLGDAASFAAADADIIALERTLADQRTALDRAKASARPDEPVDLNYGLVVDRLTTVVGDYRDLKQSRDPQDYQDMVEHYNDAIGDANDIVSR